jgi:hypothetical protein
MVARELHAIGFLRLFDVDDELIVALCLEVRHNAAKFAVAPLFVVLKVSLI